MHHVATLPHLIVKYINYNSTTATQITNEALPLLPKFLHTLILHDCPHVRDEGVLALRDHLSLHRLDLTSTKVTVKGNV